MIKKEYPHLRLLSYSFKGYYFGAFANADSNATKGYDFFISNINEKKNWCECLGFVHGKLCYHIKEAKEKFGVAKK